MEENKSAAQRYSSYKKRLMGQPRPRQTLERLEQERMPQALLKVVAEKYANGEHGEADVRAAVYTEFLQNRDRTIIPRQLEELRATIEKLRQELLWAAGRFQHLRDWKTYRVLEYGTWADFLEKELGLSEKVTGLLMMIVGCDRKSSLDTLIQIILKGYVAEPVLNEKQKPQVKRK
ncbi:MAG TPA: hypothetical protein VNV63_00215, partial [Nitrospiria bacterium]|nr:hypothetical protein [Nitrospiria bacterium]